MRDVQGRTGEDEGNHVPARDGHGRHELEGEVRRRSEVDGVKADARQREVAPGRQRTNPAGGIPARVGRVGR